MKRNFVVLLVVGLIVVFMLLYAAHRPRPTGGSALLATNSVRGQAAPGFKLVDIRTGKNVQLADFKGRVVLLNFWATWCPPCKGEIPLLVDLQNQYGPQGLQVIGVAMDDAGKAVISKFANEMKINYLVLQGTEKVADEYGGVDSLPTTFYVGRDGRIIKRVLGPVFPHDAEQSIEQALSPGGSKAGGTGSAAAENQPASTQTASSRSNP